MSFFVFILDAIFCGTNFHFSGHCVASIVILMCSLLFDSSSLIDYWSMQKRICAVVIFFSPKTVVVTVLAVFLSFWYWLLDITWFFFNLKDRAAFLGLIMHFSPVNGTCECLVFWFQFFSVESCLFMCLSVMRFFSLQFFAFLITVSGWCYHFDVLNFIQLFNSTGVVVVALVNLRWSVLSQ